MQERDRLVCASLALAMLALAACSSPESAATPAPAVAPPVAPAVAPPAAPAEPPSTATVPGDVPAQIDGANLTMESVAVDGLAATGVQCRTDGQMFAGMAIIGALAKQKAALDACAATGETVRVHFAADGGSVSDVRVAGASAAAVSRCVAGAVAAAAFPSKCACVMSIAIGPAR